MNCPICNVQLMMSERQGIEIDYCPKCRGIWLDRGELDKIIQRSAPEMVHDHSKKMENFHPGKHHENDHDYNNGKNPSMGYYKKRNLLTDLFDF
jgi:uncharacterized protein